ncbi:hypothetical protein A3Q56_02231 [Intoshia linei]|uniref:Cation-transporting P-type ATPase C-terminal domain-containing protein n=1 Tax=Intoshia linei TaxID=1819745 RepID=A0A177B8P8_9BILA|nr:hypothetical protein A3Q56_02231 [Intoshia linei]
MIYSVVLLYKNKVDTATIFIRVLDIITIIVPPALPAAMTVGFVYAQKRLKRQKIFCNSPQYISFAGLIDLACFDKTGTLTENELSVTDVITLDNNGELLSTLTKIYSLQQNCSIRKCLATAHMLTEINGAISGDPLDIAMFRATGWTLEETKEDNEKYDDLIPVIVRSKSNDEYGIMRYLPFDSSIQMMSVITSAFDNQEIMLYSKGAPEKLVKLCTHIPNNFSEILERYTRIGFRVLALASRKLNLKWHSLIHINRSELEKNFKFEGLLLTINRLKDNVHVIIDTLEKSNILTVMSTGDNINTAICVAKQSHIICDPSNVVHISQNKHRELIVNFEYALEKHAKSNVLILLLDIFMHNYENLSFYGFDSTSSIVMNGNIFELLKTQHFIFLKRIIKLCKVFARMSPNDKTALIDTYQKCGLTVSMCGDGANDCGAMKIADIGISLSKSESCFAAPFTCTDSGIDCIVTLIKEGRCALVTSYGILKYMSFYSITQFTTVLILYSNNNNLTDGMFLYIDLIITSIATLFMSNTPAYNKIVTKKPYSILKIKTIMAMLMQIFLLVSFQILVFEYLKSQPWYINDNTDSRLLSYDNYILFVFSCFQYIIGVFTYSKGPPYRKRMWNNKTLTICLTILMGINVYFLSNGTSNWFTNWMQFKIVPSITFRHSLLAIAFVQFCASYMIEYVLD